VNKSESKYFNTAIKMDQALITLLEEKNFDYITVSEICAKAGVNRSTFYLHYENTRDLLDEVSRYLLDGFLTYFPVDTAGISARFSACELKELNFISEKYLHPYLKYIKENNRVFSTALLHANSFGFEGTFQRMFQNIFDPIMDRFHYPVSHRNYVIRFYLNGINAIVTQWLKDGCQESVEEISRIIYECVFGLEQWEWSYETVKKVQVI